MRKYILAIVFFVYIFAAAVLTASASESTGILAVKNMFVLSEEIKAPGNVQFYIQLEGNEELHGVRLVFAKEEEPKRYLNYWLEKEAIQSTENAGTYRCQIELQETVIAGNYILKELELCGADDQRRNYAYYEETGLLKDWTGGLEIPAMEMVVTEGCKDTDFQTPILKDVFFEETVYAGEDLEITVEAEDASGVVEASVVFYNNSIEDYYFWNSYKTENLGNGKYKFFFKIHRYQYADTYEMDAITLVDGSMYKNSVSYWVDGAYLKNVDGGRVPFSGAKKFVSVVQKEKIQMTTTALSDFYAAVDKAKEKDTIVIVGGDSDGSLWVLDKRPLLAAKRKNLRLVLADILSESEFVIEAADIPAELPDEVYIGVMFADFEGDVCDLKLQMTKAALPFTVKFKTDKLEELKSKTFNLYRVADDGAQMVIHDRLAVDKDGYLNLEFASGVDSGKNWSQFRLVRNQQADCDSQHSWDDGGSVSPATVTEDGNIQRICKVCGLVEHQVISKIASVTLKTTTFIYNGKTKKPTVVVKDAKGKQLSENQDYTVSYASGRKNVGRYAVKVTFKGNYSGTSTKYFTIVPKAVSSLSVIRYQYGNQVRLSWTKSEGATGYRIYSKKTSASQYTYLGSTKNLYYVKGSLAADTAYRFKVIPYYQTSTGNTQYYSENAYKTVLVNTVAKGNKLSKVTKVNATRSGTKVKVSWKNVSYETGYQISRSTKKTGTNIVCTYKTTTGTNKTVTAAKNTTYYYKVRAYRVVNGKYIYGAWSDVVKYTR